MTERFVVDRDDGRFVEVIVTGLADGDFHIDNPDATARRATVTSEPWHVVRQVHSATVVDVAEAGPSVEADAIVTDKSNVPIAVQGADCAPIAITTSSGSIGVAHVGWRGLLGGVIEHTVERLNGVPTTAIVGPTICEQCYEFSPGDIDRVAAQYGDRVRATTRSGSPALDMAAGIQTALERAAVPEIQFSFGCTSCGGAGFSHRARADTGRHALVAVLREGDDAER